MAFDRKRLVHGLGSMSGVICCVTATCIAIFQPVSFGRWDRTERAAAFVRGMVFAITACRRHCRGRVVESRLVTLHRRDALMDKGRMRYKTAPYFICMQV